MTKTLHSNPTLPFILPPLLLLTPITILLLTLHLLSHLSSPPLPPPPPTTSKIFQLTSPIHFRSTFESISALLPLPPPLECSLLLSDISTNTLYHLHTSLPTFPFPFLSNAGNAQNITHAFSLRRPGISSLTLYDANASQVRVLLSRHASRDVALITLTPSTSSILTPTITSITSIATSFNETKFNSPYSVIFDPSHGMFFSDPTFGLITEADEFDRKLDDPEHMFQTGQHVYHVPTSAIEETIRTGIASEPNILIENLDRPTGLALINDTLFVAVASPRKPTLQAYYLRDGRAIEGRIMRNWTRELHQWGQKGFTSVIVGHLGVAAKRWIFVGAGNGVEVYDGWDLKGGVVDRVEVGRKPGPTNVGIGRALGEVFVGTGKGALKVTTKVG